MRSSVSYMLSHGPGEPAMSHPDYEQHAHHHACLLILVRGIGQSKPRSLQKIFERIQRVNNVKITDSSGQLRDIWVRYVREHPVENNDWGDFQTHRRLLGLITVGKFDGQTELNELCRVHESLKVKYTSTLYDSRCVLFGPAQQPTENGDCGNTKVEESLEARFTPPNNFKTRAFFYAENDRCARLEEGITEFINSLFWILESKRLERSREKVDKVSLLFAPFEKKDFVGLDLESRNNRKRCMGRITKHLADLTLQAGLIADSLTLFHTASETLRAIGDSLWQGAANEGLCAASAILLYPGIRHTLALQRNASLQEGSPQRAANTQDPETLAKQALGKKSGLVINLDSDIIIATNTSSPVQALSTPIASSGSSGGDSTASFGSSVESSNASSTCDSSSSATFPTDSVPAAQGALATVGIALPTNILVPDEITTRYREAIINYSKYRHAGIIETEAALKAARICIEQNRNLDVSMFLQNVLYINLNMSELERVQRFETLTDLYQRIGYVRKAAFCQRLAAWRYVAQSNSNPDWGQSYRLMLDSFVGHRLSLDPMDVLAMNAGWPCLQVDLLYQLVNAARRLGHSALATRHMTFLLQTMWRHLSAVERKEFSLQLQSLSAQCEGSPVPLVLDSGTVIPPANLTDLPACTFLGAQNSTPHLRPQPIAAHKVDNGPFLFTPIHFSSIDRRSQKKDASKVPFSWVQYDMCDVQLRLSNPLPFELRVADMRLLTTGVVFEALPQTVVLPAGGQPTTVTLHGTPLEAGTLDIQGYSTHALGVKSNCRLKHMQTRTAAAPPQYSVTVIPALPQISVKTSLPQTATFSGLANSDCVTTSARLTLYNGESSDCCVTVTNTSAVPVDYVDGTLQSTMDVAQQGRIFQWNVEDLRAKLPIAPGASVDFPVKIYGDADFLGPTVAAATITDGPTSLSGHASLPSRVSSPGPPPQRRTELTSSFRSSQSGHSSLATLSLGGASGAGGAPRHLEVQLRLRYSGGEGQTSGFCRQCAISFCIELLPSAQITNWDVLPAEIASQFYLVLDVVNLTAQEMSFQYTNTKNILIEAKESCRVPVPVERCPLDRIVAEAAAALERERESQQMSIMSGGIPTEIDQAERACSAHIADQVNLRWTLAGTETHGIASLRGINLSPTMLDLVTVAPLQWEVLVDSAPIAPQSEVTCCSGQFVTLSVAIRNLSPQALQQLSLRIQFYQDFQNGVHNYRLETRVTMSGPNQIFVPILEKGERAFHECSVVFFTPGRFKADIQCRALNTNLTTISTSGAGGGAVGGGGGSVSNASHDASHSAVMSEQTNFAARQGDSHVWRFIPPVEITVADF